MSDVAAVALITGVITGVVGLAGLAFSFWNSSRERAQRLAERRQDDKEWYRRTLFERRLAALQEGSWHLRRLNLAINQVKPSGNPQSEENKELLRTVNEAQEWYGKNFLYIHGGMPDECPFAAFLFATQGYAKGRLGVPEVRFWQGASDLFKERASELLEGLKNHDR